MIGITRWIPVVAAVMVIACGGRATPRPVWVAERAPTAGDRLLSRVPLGAHLLFEIDLARLRANSVVGAAISEQLSAGTVVPGTPAALVGPLAAADTVVLAAYRVGTSDAATITLVSGGARPPDALDLGDGVWGLAPEGETAALLVAAAGGPSAATDLRLLEVRARAMPTGGDGASVRITAQLDSTAQVALATALGVAAVPANVSMWGDVADDLAVIAHFADRPARSNRSRSAAWSRSVAALFQRLATADAIRAVGLSRPFAHADVRNQTDGMRIAIVIGPGQLARAVGRFRAERSLNGATPVALGEDSP